MSERGNEFELWPSHFVGEQQSDGYSIRGWPPLGRKREMNVLKGKRTILTAEEVQQHLNAGVSQKQIAAIVGCAADTVSRFFYKNKLTTTQERHMFGNGYMQRATVSELAVMADLHPNTIRRWADTGIIESKRDYKGWRFFLNPLDTVKRIRGLLNGDIQLQESICPESGSDAPTESE